MGNSWQTATDSDVGNESLSIGSGSRVGPHTVTSSQSMTDSMSSAATQTFGLDGTIASGSDSTNSAMTATSTGTTLNNGTNSQPDPVGGVSFTSPLQAWPAARRGGDQPGPT